MQPDHTVTDWIQALKGGDEDAASRIWERFFQRVCNLARRRLGDSPRSAVDEEDIAASAMQALCTGARDDRFRKLEDRSDLWGILAMITAREAIKVRDREHLRQGSYSADDLLAAPDDNYLDRLGATCRELLHQLDPKLRTVALLKMEGQTNPEIAGRIDKSKPTVERYLRMIRHAWRDAESNSAGSPKL